MSRSIARAAATAFALLLGWSIPGCGSTDQPVRPAPPPAKTGPSVAIVRGTVVAAPGQAPIPNGVVLIEGGRIAAVGPASAVRVPAGATLIDAAGATVLAGFWNAHVHFSDPVWKDAATAPAGPLERELERLFTRWGFVHLLDTGSDPAVTLALRRRIEAGEIAGPSIRTAGAPLAPADGTPTYVRAAGFTLPELTSPDQARAMVAQFADLGMDAIKIFAVSFTGAGPKGTAEMPVDIIQAVAQEAHRRHLPVLAHPTNGDGLRAAIDGGVDVLLHTTPDGGPWAPGTAQALVDHRIALVPTLELWRWELTRKGRRPADVETFVDVAIEQLRSFAAAGGVVLFGTDLGYMPDPDTAEELRAMAKAGIDFAGLLASLTTAPAERFGASRRTGAIRTGLDADLVVVDGDPSADPAALSRVRLTMRAGRIVWRASSGSAPREPHQQ